MLKRSITYTNFNDVEVTEDFYFNISKSEIAEMELGRIPGGSFGSYMQRIVDAKDISAMIVEFKNLLLLSYGRKSEDGRSFMKNDQIRAEFEASPAYDLMFIEFATDAEKAYQFIEGVLPKDVVADINRDDVKAKYVAATTATTPTTPAQES